jgi:hypothetical protein
MEKSIEYGNCLEDLMKIIDMENRHANREMKRWVEEEDDAAAGKKEVSHAEYEMEEAHRVLGSQTIGRKEERKKDRTGGEVWMRMIQKNEERSVKRVKLEGRRMVKRGEMKTLHNYFKRNSSD